MKFIIYVSIIKTIVSTLYKAYVLLPTKPKIAPKRKNSL